ALAEQIQAATSAGQSSKVPPLVPMVRESEVIPLSFAQQRLWFFDQFAPGNSMYNLPQAMRLQGALDLTALQQTLNEIVQRHEALRTTFVAVNGQPMQKIASSLEVQVRHVDLTHLAEAEQEVEAQRVMRDEAASPFDLAQGPLFRTMVIKLSEQSHLLVLNTHHIVSDGWSQGVFARELVALYEAFAKGSPSPLDSLPVQYVDYANWQKHWLQPDVLAPQADYWKRKLAGELPVLQLPTDRPRPAAQTFNGAKQTFVLSPQLSKDVKSFSQREGVTPFMTLLAAYNTLLSRYSGQEDILVGAAIANRQQAELEAMIGFFVNMLVMRTDLSGNPTFRELLGRVRQTALEAYAHQDLPFEQLVDELQMERSVAHSQLFQAAFSFVNVPQSRTELSGLSLEFMEIDHQAAQFDITLFMEEADGVLIGRFEYNTDLFDASTI
ncbi:MAG: condensation domain-containing protein, partial [Tumebacillaceae bacterium]